MQHVMEYSVEMQHTQMQIAYPQELNVLLQEF